MYEVAVVGAGPAGASAAIAAARAGASVLLLDRYDFPRDKPCGDGIAPQVFEELEKLDVSNLDAGYPPLPWLSLTGPSGAVAARPMATPCRVIPRTVFDARLVAAAVDRGVTLRKHHVKQITEAAGRIIIDGFEARTLIGADGASSIVRRHLGEAPNRPGHIAIAIRGYQEHAPEDPLVQRIVMSKAGWPAYAWSFPIGDGRRNVGYGEMLRGPAVTREQLLRRLTELMPDIDAEGTQALRAHLLPLSTHRPTAGRGRVMLAGDALSLINPFTGEGIYYAVVSGALAGETAALLSGPDAAQWYRLALRKRLGRHLRHTQAAARLATFPAIVDAGIRAGARDQKVFDTLVELGLGEGLLTSRVLWKSSVELVLKREQH
jgi:geranylgeranyl reductase family protein